MKIAYIGSRRGKSFEQFLNSWSEYVLKYFGENVKITVHDQKKTNPSNKKLRGLRKSYRMLKI